MVVKTGYLISRERSATFSSLAMIPHVHGASHLFKFQKLFKKARIRVCRRCILPKSETKSAT
jgi:hypothetical protein